MKLKHGWKKPGEIDFLQTRRSPVATAEHLRATHFLTFNERQRKLARHAGLEVPL
jgi:hypothetical protein